MAKFRAVVRGNCGGVSRLGNRSIEASVNAWDVGVDVRGFTDTDGSDVIEVVLTNGSPTKDKTKQTLKTLRFTKADVVSAALALLP